LTPLTPRSGDGAATIRFQTRIGKDKLGGASRQDRNGKRLGRKKAIGATTAPIV
jgi:hypothetical protein